MSTEIGQLKGAPAPGLRERERVSRSPDENGEAREGRITAQLNTDQVQISHSALRMRQTEAQLAQLPEIDRGRVEVIRNALSEGSYRVDAQRLADRLLAQERMFSGGGER